MLLLLLTNLIKKSFTTLEYNSAFQPLAKKKFGVKMLKRTPNSIRRKEDETHQMLMHTLLDSETHQMLMHTLLDSE